MPHNPAIPLLIIYPREMKISAHTKTRTWMFTAVLFITMIRPNWKQSKLPSIGRWSIWYIHTIEYSSVIKNDVWICMHECTCTNLKPYSVKVDRFKRLHAVWQHLWHTRKTKTTRKGKQDQLLPVVRAVGKSGLERDVQGWYEYSVS